MQFPQLWRAGQGGRLLSALDPALCLGAFSVAAAAGSLGLLGARRIRDGEPVVLVRLDSEFALAFSWGDGRDIGDDNTNHEGEIVCLQDTALRLWPAGRGHGVEMQSSSSKGQTWALTAPPNLSPKPLEESANSLIVRYCGASEAEVGDSWTLECTLEFKNGKRRSFFGWGPGGYCAIERTNDDKVMVSFSMWKSEHAHHHEVLEMGNGVTQEDSNNEIKSMLEIARIDEEATFIASGERSSDTWRCSCWLHQSATQPADQLIATYELVGVKKRPPLSPAGIHVLLEDGCIGPPKNLPRVSLNGRILTQLSLTKLSVEEFD